MGLWALLRPPSESAPLGPALAAAALAISDSAGASRCLARQWQSSAQCWNWIAIRSQRCGKIWRGAMVWSGGGWTGGWRTLALARRVVAFRCSRASRAESALLEVVTLSRNNCVLSRPDAFSLVLACASARRIGACSVHALATKLATSRNPTLLPWFHWHLLWHRAVRRSWLPPFFMVQLSARPE